MKPWRFTILALLLVISCLMACSGRNEGDPKDAQAYLDRGNSHLQKGNWDQAIADFSRALELAPKSDDAYFGRGRAYAFKRDLDRALADYSQALELNPKLAEAYDNRGNIYLQKK